MALQVDSHDQYNSDVENDIKQSVFEQDLKRKFSSPVDVYELKKFLQESARDNIILTYSLEGTKSIGDNTYIKIKQQDLDLDWHEYAFTCKTNLYDRYLIDGWKESVKIEYERYVVDER